MTLRGLCDSQCRCSCQKSKELLTKTLCEGAALARSTWADPHSDSWQLHAHHESPPAPHLCSPPGQAAVVLMKEIGFEDRQRLFGFPPGHPVPTSRMREGQDGPETPNLGLMERETRASSSLK